MDLYGCVIFVLRHISMSFTVLKSSHNCIGHQPFNPPHLNNLPIALLPGCIIVYRVHVIPNNGPTPPRASSYSFLSFKFPQQTTLRLKNKRRPQYPKTVYCTSFFHNTLDTRMLLVYNGTHTLFIHLVRSQTWRRECAKLVTLQFQNVALLHNNLLSDRTVHSYFTIYTIYP